MQQFIRDDTKLTLTTVAPAQERRGSVYLGHVAHLASTELLEKLRPTIVLIAGPLYTADAFTKFMTFLKHHAGHLFDSSKRKYDVRAYLPDHPQYNFNEKDLFNYMGDVIREGGNVARGHRGGMRLHVVILVAGFLARR